ncbi:MAG: hypothetical protein CMJ58_19620 [Planctomycetaceae bacterium]|nr:hypothetical protein [Planctomycetaceae bacterium]
MASFHSLASFSRLLRRGYCPPASSTRLAARARGFHLERLEDRCLMDGAGFIHTDPEPDPDSIVGVAEIEAHDDYAKATAATHQLRIDVLANDVLPEDAEGLRIKSVSDTLRGAKVNIVAGGKAIQYIRAADAPVYDSFYYIVEDEDGRLGKANVTIREQRTGSGGGSATPYWSAHDSYTLYEDAPATTLNVLANDREFKHGEIIALTAPERLGGAASIAADGTSIIYQPPAAQTGYDRFEYTVRAASGEEASFTVVVNVDKPVVTQSERYGFRLDIDAPTTKLDVLASDRVVGPVAQTPLIVDVSYPEVVGEIAIAADGRSLEYSPANGFIGSFTLEYVLRYGSAEHQVVSGSERVTVQNSFLAVDNWFQVATDANATALDLLANDPVLPRYSNDHRRLPDSTLTIVDVTAGSSGGTVALVDGRVLYTPAAGFAGEETFTYAVRDERGHEDSAEVTVQVGEPAPTGPLRKFYVPGELRQFLIDQAVERYQSSFGVTSIGYQYLDGPIEYYATSRTGVIAFDGDAMTLTSDYSTTNTQEAGVDEADIAETDGRYVYTFAHGKLVIVDLNDPTDPQPVSFTEFADRFDEMYLQGDRLTLLRRGWGKGSPSVVAVVDVSDRSAPSVVERTEIDGRIVESRAVGDRVFVAVNGIDLPPLEIASRTPANENGFSEYQTYETLDQYVARVSDTLIDDALPRYRTYDADGVEVAAGLLTAPQQIYEPNDASDNQLLSLVTFDVADGRAGPDHSVGVFSAPASEVYMSGSSLYVFRSTGNETAILKFAIAEDGSSDLVATGTVAGTLLNQFSVDEHEGQLRIATTEVRLEVSGTDRWGNPRLRQQQRFNNLLVLEEQSGELVRVGGIENLAPTETIKSVRFLDDRAYVTTFRVVDPLFAVDLSDPTEPVVTGALKIPGYSDYLHPVGEDYVIGIGRDADEITGRLGPLQVSLFYVGGDAPAVVDQVTLDGAGWHQSEAWFDHHAVAYFAEQGVLTLPVSWTETTEFDDNGDGWRDRVEYESFSAMWAFEIEVDDSGGGALDIGGRVAHETDGHSWYGGNAARRSMRIGDALVTLSEDYLLVNELHNVEQQIGAAYLGVLPQDDAFTIEEDSGPIVLDVLANDRPGVDGTKPSIIDVSTPGRSYGIGQPWGVPGLIDFRFIDVVTVDVWQPMTVDATYAPVSFDAEPPGTVEIAEDGGSLTFTPRADFAGAVSFTYTVHDALRGDQIATVTVTVTPVDDAPIANDDEFEVAAGETTPLDVLANDSDPDGYSGGTWRQPIYTDVLSSSYLVLDADTAQTLPPFSYVYGVKIIAVSAGDQGGSIEIDELGRGMNYTPADGFTGLETFTYTIADATGLEATATVSVWVGVEKPDESVLASPGERPVLLTPTAPPPSRPATRAALAPQTSEVLRPAPRATATNETPLTEKASRIIAPATQYRPQRRAALAPPAELSRRLDGDLVESLAIELAATDLER